jgi:hypothetical protein
MGEEESDGLKFEPSEDEPDPDFSSLLPKSPDASSDSFDSTPPSPDDSQATLKVVTLCVEVVIL